MSTVSTLSNSQIPTSTYEEVDNCTIYVKLVYTSFILQENNVNIHERIGDIKTRLISRISNEMGITDPILLPIGQNFGEATDDMSYFNVDNATLKYFIDRMNGPMYNQNYMDYTFYTRPSNVALMHYLRDNTPNNNIRRLEDINDIYNRAYIDESTLNVRYIVPWVEPNANLSFIGNCNVCFAENTLQNYYSCQLPSNIHHGLCASCYEQWHTRSRSCPTCRQPEGPVQHIPIQIGQTSTTTNDNDNNESFLLDNTPIVYDDASRPRLNVRHNSIIIGNVSTDITDSIQSSMETLNNVQPEITRRFHQNNIFNSICRIIMSSFNTTEDISHIITINRNRPVTQQPQATNEHVSSN